MSGVDFVWGIILRPFESTDSMSLLGTKSLHMLCTPISVCEIIDWLNGPGEKLGPNGCRWKFVALLWYGFSAEIGLFLLGGEGPEYSWKEFREEILSLL